MAKATQPTPRNKAANPTNRNANKAVDKRMADNLSSATDAAQVNTEVFEIDEEALAALEPAEQVSTLRTKLAKAKEEFVATMQINKSLTAAVENLKADSLMKPPAAPEQPAPADRTISDKTFKVDGKTYGFAAFQTKYKGNLIGADEILADEELQAQLVKGKYGIVKEVSTK